MFTFVEIPRGLTNLQSGKHEHLLFGAVQLLVQQLPLGLLVQLVNAHLVVLGVQIEERVVLEAQQQCFVLANALLHNGLG